MRIEDSCVNNHSRSTVCALDMCCGCNLCVSICSRNAIEIRDELKTLNAMIDADKCISCALCHRLCPQNNNPRRSEPIYWYQGWAEDEIRSNSSSGGFATALARQFIIEGGTIYSCKLENGDFIYSSAQSMAELEGFSGSKYVKSNPGTVYTDIKKCLLDNRKVLVIGLPCHIGALKNYIPDNLQEKLITIDLICHGSPSVKLLSMALSEYGYDLHKAKEVLFRNKDKYAVKCDYHPITPVGTWDRYTMGFLNGTFFTENCYSCQYAGVDRTGDITLGDSWGTDLVGEENKGISLALCQTEKGYNLLESAGLTLCNVDKETATANNEQLSHPYIMPSNRKVFFDSIERGCSFKKSMYNAFPKKCIKQSIKGALIRINIWNVLDKAFHLTKRGAKQ